ncbi:MAG: damage-inducible protein DinB [Marinosulfonomonas sp.]|nr:MAG: damage-inducible protein DinB [Marinosulfonomonas sp.]
MITPEYVQMMARYNQWQNRNLYGAADTLDDAARRMDRGAFFASIHNTLAHILWGDTLWMSRFDGWQPPTDEGGIVIAGWDGLKQARIAADVRFVDWGEHVQQEDLQEDFEWHPAWQETALIHPYAQLVVQVFNHQTHHRGQVHAMLTAAGAKPHETDLPFLPER